MKIIYHEPDGSINELTTEEYFKDKPPIPYTNIVQFTSPEKAKLGNWIGQDVICDKVAMIGSLCIHSFNPSWNPEKYIQSQGYTIISHIPQTGASVYLLKNNP